MTKFVAVGLMVLVAMFGVATAERSGNRTMERCTDSQDAAERVRCERLSVIVEQGATTDNQPTCERARSTCTGGRTGRSTRPPFWIGHHYSGL
jgi:hypothetical protein